MPVYDANLRRLVRQRLDSGRLPAVPPGHTLAGQGSDCACAVCEAIISPRELEYETESGDAGAQHFHIACYTAWFMESQTS